MTSKLNTLPNTKTDRVYRTLRQMIIDLEMYPGQMINKNELVDFFGVSRAPINEALARLQEEDLVYIAPQHGTFVQRITIAKLEEGIFLRRVVEPHAMHKVAPLVTDEVMADLQHIFEQQVSAVEANDLSTLLVLDDAFHTAILQLGGLEYVQRLIRTFSAHLERARNLTPDIKREPQETLRDHRALLQALSQRDGFWAQSVVDMHLARTSSALKQKMDEDPDLFNFAHENLKSQIVTG